jgi:tetratricopeptide (TPR) repeat protein
MTFPVRLSRVTLAVLLLAGLSGCLPSSRSQLDEEKESHFLAGRNRLNSMDYGGAIEEFHRALEANPRSASAHFQLGWLYEEKKPDPAAAIYHYEQFLKLRPNSDNAEVIRQHINNCKQDLAKTVLPLPITPGLQHQFEQLAAENKRLRDELEKWKAYASRLQMPTTPQAHTPAPVGAEPATSQASPTSSSQQSVAAESRPSLPTARTYVVKEGDTLYAIARKTGVRLEGLLGANPGLDPRRLRVGQTLNLPPP